MRRTTASVRRRAPLRHALGLLVAGAALAACGDELGPCNEEAASELVYGRNQSVATKGQALVQDSCGNGVFCHSSGATGDARHGAPRGMDFDMLPTATGLATLLEMRDEVWDVVNAGQMPPAESRSVVGNGDWSFDVLRRPEGPRLPALSTKEGKAALRNWLACGAPVVTETTVPDWAQPEQNPFEDPAYITWDNLHRDVIMESCALASCHNALSGQGGLVLEGEACETRGVLLAFTSDCGQPLVQPGNADGSSLLQLVSPEGDRSCGELMPPPPGYPPLPKTTRDAIRTWIEQGAQATGCE